MAFGFPAHFEQVITLPDGISSDDFEYLLENIGWRLVSSHNGEKWSYRNGVNFWSWGEDIFIEKLSGGEYKVRSQCLFPLQCIDWGKNASNVRLLHDALKHLAGYRLKN
ncbi:MAG: hypothetical protein L6Q71_02390, partial [Planctomycetes bacterium]|nr:hypothetical protein [Planctomycetota bacterium]